MITELTIDLTDLAATDDTTKPFGDLSALDFPLETESEINPFGDLAALDFPLETESEINPFGDLAEWSLEPRFVNGQLWEISRAKILACKRTLKGINLLAKRERERAR